MTQALTNPDEYKPTHSELKILEVLSDPTHYRKSVTEKCELAGISRETYYQSMRKSDFVNLIPMTALQLVKSRATDLINASYDAALKGSFADRELLLEMAGLKVDKKQETNVQVNNFVVVRGE